MVGLDSNASILTESLVIFIYDSGITRYRCWSYTSIKRRKRYYNYINAFKGVQDDGLYAACDLLNESCGKEKCKAIALDNSNSNIAGACNPCHEVGQDWLWKTEDCDSIYILISCWISKHIQKNIHEFKGFISKLSLIILAVVYMIISHDVL